MKTRRLLALSGALLLSTGLLAVGGSTRAAKEATALDVDLITSNAVDVTQTVRSVGRCRDSAVGWGIQPSPKDLGWTRP